VPVVSALRFGTDNVPRTSTIAVMPGEDGSISVLNGPGTSDLNIDIQGYFTAVALGTQPQPGGFVPVVPERILDTTAGLGAPEAKVGPGQSLRVQVSGFAGVPEDASAVFANIRVRDVEADGTLRVVPSGDDPTLVKPLLHYSVGGSDGVGASFKLGSGGAVMMYNSGSQPIHLDFDVQGYFSENPTAGGGFHPVPLTRIWNSTLAAGKEIRVPVGGANGLPTYGVGGAMLGIIAENYSATGNLSLFQAGKPATGLGNVTFHAGEGGLPNSGTAVIRPGDSGEVVVHNSSAGPVDVRVSLMGWFPAQRVVSEADEADFRSDATDLGADEDWVSQAIFDEGMFGESDLLASEFAYYYYDPSTVDADSAVAPNAAATMLDAVFACMVQTGQVAGTATREATLGDVASDGSMTAPTNEVEPSDDCITGAQQRTEDAIVSATSPEDVDSNLLTLQTGIAEGEQIPPITAPPTPEAAEGPIPGDGGSGGTVGINGFIAGMNVYSHKSLAAFRRDYDAPSYGYLNWSSDECSAPLIGNGPYNFEWPCRRHDFGWRNLKRASNWYDSNTWRAKNKARADKQFRWDLVGHCTNKYGKLNPLRYSCIELAGTYFVAVSLKNPRTVGISAPDSYSP
jgi:Prokaryotic phospholipase A2